MNQIISNTNKRLLKIRRLHLIIFNFNLEFKTLGKK